MQSGSGPWIPDKQILEICHCRHETIVLTIDKIEQRHWLAAQGMDNMAIVDDMATFAVGLRSPASQGDDKRRALEAFEPVVIKAHAQPMTDQSRGNRVKHLAQREGAGGGDIDIDLLIIGGLAGRQFF